MHLLYTTIATKEEGKTLLKTLLEEKSIACGSLIPLESMYYWKNALQEETEYGILMKIPTEKKEEVIKRIAELHPYEVPLISTWPVEVNTPYQEWLHHSLSLLSEKE